MLFISKLLGETDGAKLGWVIIGVHYFHKKVIAQKYLLHHGYYNTNLRNKHIRTRRFKSISCSILLIHICESTFPTYSLGNFTIFIEIKWLLNGILSSVYSFLCHTGTTGKLPGHPLKALSNLASFILVSDKIVVVQKGIYSTPLFA